MKKNLKQGLAIIVTSAMVLAYAQVSIAASPTKEVIPSWVSSEIAAWKENGLLKGDQKGLVHPNQAISKAEFVALVNRVFKYTLTSDKTFSDVPSNAWYAMDISKAFASGVLVGDDRGVMQPLNHLTKEEAAIILSRVFKVAVPSSATSKFTDDSSISFWAKEAVISLNEAGYINGTAEGEFQPQKTITRAETVKMINNVMGKIVADSNLHSDITGRNLVVNTAGGALANLSLSGNLYITPGVGEGNLTIKSSNIAGTVYVLGGGTHSIVFEDSKLNEIVVSKPSSPVRVFLTGSTALKTIDLLSSTLVENGTKNPIENLHVDAGADSTINILGNVNNFDTNSGSTINVGQAEITNFNVSQSAAGSKINLDANAKVDKLVVNASTTIKGDGKVADATINADNVAIETAPTKINLNVEHVNVGDKKLTKETINQPTPTPTPASTVTPVPTLGPSGPGVVTPAQPAAPNVTLNDVTNIVTGLTTEMEYKLDNAEYVMYDAAIFNALDLSGTHTLLVRIPANAITGAPAGLATTLNFTPAPNAPAAPNVTLNDVTNIVTGLTTEMEYKLDNAEYVMYDAAIFNALDLSGTHTLLVRIAANAITGAPAGLATTLNFTPAPNAPAAPNVTLNDVTNIVTGLTTEMEYKLDNAEYVMYNAAIFNALDLSGTHTLLVRIPANAITGAPAGLVTTLNFTPNPAPGKYTYNDVLTTFNYAGAPNLVKQYLLFQKAQDPTYTHAIENNIIQVPQFTNARNFVNAEYTVKPSIFASLRGVNTSVLDASRTYLWIGTNDGVTKINLTNNEMTSYTLANGKLLDNHVLLLISDGNTGVFAITDSGVAYIQN